MGGVSAFSRQRQRMRQQEMAEVAAMEELLADPQFEDAEGDLEDDFVLAATQVLCLSMPMSWMRCAPRACRVVYHCRTASAVHVVSLISEHISGRGRGGCRRGSDGRGVNERSPCRLGSVRHRPRIQRLRR